MDIMEKTYELIDVLDSSSLIKDLAYYKNKILSNRELCSLIDKGNKEKDEYVLMSIKRVLSLYEVAGRKMHTLFTFRHPNTGGIKDERKRIRCAGGGNEPQIAHGIRLPEGLCHRRADLHIGAIPAEFLRKMAGKGRCRHRRVHNPGLPVRSADGPEHL